MIGDLPGHSLLEGPNPASPKQSSGSGSQEERAQQIARFKYLTEALLPALGRQQRWPIRLDHCFKRICLDHAFNDIWYRHLQKPAEKHLAGTPLARALQCAEELVLKGLPALKEHNEASLRYRGRERPRLNCQVAARRFFSDVRKCGTLCVGTQAQASQAIAGRLSLRRPAVLLTQEPLASFVAAVS